MGFLDFLKKSKEDNKQEELNNQPTDDLKIPLPDQHSMADDDLSALEPKKEGLDAPINPPVSPILLENEKNEEPDMTDFSKYQETEENPTIEPTKEDFGTQKPIMEEKEPEKTVVNDLPKEEYMKKEDKKVDEPDDPSDFSLPDFSEDDFKIGSLSEDLNQSKKEETKVEEVKATQPAPLLTGDDLADSSSESRVSEDSKENNYLEMDKCKKVFDSIYKIQKIVENSNDSVLRQENLNKNELQQYKNIHDNLDNVQEKFMEIDNTLFEG